MKNFSILSFSVLLALFFILWGWGLRVNLTSSLPVGLYKSTDQLERGTVAVFCLESKSFIAIAKERGYLRPGECSGGLRPLGKEVYGIPGDLIELVGGHIEINGREIPGSEAHKRDSQGRSMPASELSPGVIPEGKVLMLSLHHQGSFDGRYFGLVRIARLHPVRPVLTWN